LSSETTSPPATPELASSGPVTPAAPKANRVAVHIPQPVTRDKLFAGLIGSACEDFVVDEVPAYPFDGEGEHWLVQIGKRGLNTADVVKIVSKQSKARERDVGVAGQKDKHAVTSQWLSLSTVGTIAPSEWQLPDGVELLQVTKHRNKLRTGHLAGNRFRLRLIGDVIGDMATLRGAAERLREAGVPNYYGPQRFGFGLSNLDKALAWLTRQASGGGRGSRFVAKWMPSVIQSEVFNRYVAKRLELGVDRLLVGEIVRLQGSSRHFEVDAPDVELPRLLSRDIVLTGPMVGPKTRGASREALELEQSVIAELGLTEDALRILGQHAPGTRRDLLMWPEGLTAELQSDGSLVLEFALPAGSYATVLAAEFTHCPFGQERQRSQGASQGDNAGTTEGGSDDDED
jgi:tRNA pseudouridine13 synthase